MKIKLPFTTVIIKKDLNMKFEEMFSYHLRFFPSFYFFGIIDISLIISVYFSTRLFAR